MRPHVLMPSPTTLLFLILPAVAQAMPELVLFLPEERVYDGNNPAEHAPRLSAARGFTFDLEVRPVGSPEAGILFSQEGLTLLRTDPISAGGNLSFLVAINGNLEHRLHTEPLPAGQWSRVTASWDSALMWTRVNKRTYRADRAGTVTDATAPLRVAAGRPVSGGGFRGAMRNVRIYDTSLTETDLLLELR